MPRHSLNCPILRHVWRNVANSSKPNVVLPSYFPVLVPSGFDCSCFRSSDISVNFHVLQGKISHPSSSYTLHVPQSFWTTSNAPFSHSGELNSHPAELRVVVLDTSGMSKFGQMDDISDELAVRVTLLI